jgi:hypothetical protein
MSIIIVQLNHQNGAKEEVCMDENEMRLFPANAFQAIWDTAGRLTPGQDITRLTYLDDEGDHCSLSAETIPDALTFTESCGDSVRTLKVTTVASSVEPAEPQSTPRIAAHGADERAVHFNVVCDVTNMCPLVGKRYKKLGEDYDLCEEEFNKLPEEAQASFVCIARPGDKPVPAVAASAASCKTILKESCPKGHALVDYVEPNWGDCDGCGKHVKAGEALMDCRACNWYLCRGCHAGPRTAAESNAASAAKSSTESTTGELPRPTPISTATSPQQLERDVLAAALEQLLQHPDLAVQAATQKAIQDAKNGLQNRFAPPLCRNQVVHEGVSCDVTGMCPIVGVRYKKRGENYDLCETAFEKLSEEERSAFIRIPQPGCEAAAIEELQSRHGWDASCLANVVNSRCAAALESLLNRFPRDKLDKIEASLELAFGQQREYVLPCLNELHNQIGAMRPAIEAALAAGDFDQALAGISTCCKEVVGRVEELKSQAHGERAPDSDISKMRAQTTEDACHDTKIAELREALEEETIAASDDQDLSESISKMRAQLSEGYEELAALGTTWLFESKEKTKLKELLERKKCELMDMRDRHSIGVRVEDLPAELKKWEVDYKNEKAEVLGTKLSSHMTTSEVTSGSSSSAAEETHVKLFEGDASSGCTNEVTSAPVDTAYDASLQVPMAAVVSSCLDIGGNQLIFEDAELRGDATEEFSELLSQYPNVTQVYRLGCVALSLGAGVDGACSTCNLLSKIVVQNKSTEVPWSESSSIRSVAGPSHGLSEMMLGAVPAGDTVEVVLDLEIKKGEGGRSAWAICDQRGEPFGPLLLFETVHM